MKSVMNQGKSDQLMSRCLRWGLRNLKDIAVGCCTKNLENRTLNRFNSSKKCNDRETGTEAPGLRKTCSTRMAATGNLSHKSDNFKL